MPLTREQWSRIKEVVADALDIPTGERHAFVQHACKGDACLMEEALSLLSFQPSIAISAPSDPGFAQGSLLLDRYLVERTIGRGGFASAWLAFDQQLLNRRVVIKLLGSANADPYIRRKFADELRALAALEHPNIIAPLDSGLTPGGVPFIVTQFAEGSTLGTILNQGRLPFDRAGRILAQVGRTLSFIHDAGIVHRDLKPENIIVQTFADGVDHVRLIDFGIASVDGAGLDRSTRIIGSVVYMAPEQLLGTVSPATDMYALGVIAYEMLTGELPFSTSNPVELARLHAKGLLIRPRQLRAELDPDAELLLLRALERDPAKRPVSPAQFTARLAQALHGEPQSKRSPVFLLLALSLTALLLVIAIVFLRHRLVPTPSVATKRAQNPSPSPTIISVVTLNLERRTPPGALTPNAEGALSLQDGDEFRVLLTSMVAGHLYLFSETAANSGLHILFPSPRSNLGRSQVNESQRIQIPQLSWFRIDSRADTGGAEDVLDLVWSRVAVTEFEAAKRFENETNRGEIPDGPERAAMQMLLERKHPLTANGSEWSLQGPDGATFLVGEITVARAEKNSPQAVVHPPVNTLSYGEVKAQ